MKRNMQTNQEWRTIVGGVRKEALRVLNDIRGGIVNEVDLDKLQNFVQFSLALMLNEGPEKWARAKLNAEMASLMDDAGVPREEAV